ncbi:LPXTG cell wall anchor domain-containing protein [Lactococcus allomyrinae]|uniref:LPXTG cell wall anchor domain-containing protein n=1 Tax=Lactococcus allomyrinae TaxID=2419773 RepID=A0A387BCV9_9LACT|nr:LPXTG cell wall anchor domain-containing protein [Lactococcus allomyrinae]AYF99861.1 LPXTG cell wall anchor domain-containing protein [Lactococcus allomyrinae]
MFKKEKGFRSWKAGKHWLYSAGVLAILVSGGMAVSNLTPLALHAQAATSMPSDFTQVGSIGSAPLYQTSNTSWTNINGAIKALVNGQTPDYYVGAAKYASDGKTIIAGQPLGWYDGQTQYPVINGGTFGSLLTADPSDLSQPNYNFVNVAIMQKDGFTDSDNFNYITAPGQAVPIYDVGEAYETSTGKFIPVGLKIKINDATYYDSGSSTTPRDVFSDGYKLMVAARNDGNGNITLGYVVVMNGVVAQNNGGGSEGGGSGSGTGNISGGCTTGIPKSVNGIVTYVNENTGEVLPNNSISAVKVADIDAGQSADISSNSLGYFISNPTHLSLQNNVLTASTDHTVTSDASTLDANSYVTLKNINSFALTFTDTLGNQQQGSIVESLFGRSAVSLPVPDLVKNVLTKTETSGASPSGVSQAGAEFELKNENPGKFVNASDTGSDEVEASNGKMNTSSDGTLEFTTGSDGKVGVENLPSVDGNGKTITYQWVEVNAPDGEAISASGSGQEFSANLSTPADSDGNIPTADTNISDKPLLEAQLNKNSTNAAFNNALGDATYEAYNSDGTPITTDDGLDPATGKAADVDVVTGTLVTSVGSGEEGDGPLIVKANAQGQIDVKNMDGTQVSKDITWKEISPAAGHALNNQVATGTFSTTTLNSDKSNFLVTSTTTDKPMGETAIAKLDADTGNSTTQGAATLQGAEFTLEDATGAPVKQSQGVDPKTGAAANVVLTSGTTYAPDANGNIVLVTNDKGVAGQVENLDLTNNLNYQWVETKAPYGYAINDKPDAVTFSPSNTVDTATNNYEDSQKLSATISDRVVDFGFSFTKDAADQGATGLNGAEFTLTPLTGTQNSLGQFDNGKDTNINGQDTFISPDTGLAIPVTDVSQLFLGTTQTSHDYTDPQGNQSAGWVEYNHVQVGKYKLVETSTPKGYAPVDEMEVDILPDTDTTGAPTSYELKVTDTVTGNVLRDETIPVSYSTSQSGRQLIDDNNSLGKFNLGQLIDKLPVPSIDVEKANDAVPDAGKGNDTDADNNVGVNDHDTVATADNAKAGATTTIDFRITNNGTDDLTKVTAKDKTTSGSVDIGAITWTYNGQTVTLNSDGYFVTADGSVLTLSVGQSITGTATLPALPAGQLHTDQIAVSGIGIQSGGDVQDHDNWNGETPKPSIDIEKANGTTPKAGKGNNTDTANNDGTNDHDTAATADKVKNKATTQIYFNGTNNGTEPLTDIKVGDKTTAGSVAIGAITWTYKGQTLKTNADGYLTLQDGTLLTLAPNENITGTGLLPALPAGELHTDNATIAGVGTLDKVPVGDNDNWNGITPLTVKTTAHTTGTDQIFTPSSSTQMYDTVETNAPKGDIQVAYLHKITPDGKDTIVATVSFTIDDATVEAEKDTVLKSIDTSKDVVGTRYVWGEAIFAKGADIKTDKPLATFYDKNDKAETLTPVTTPVALTPAKPNLTIILPDTGTKALAWLTGIGVAILAAVGGTTFYKKRKKGSDKAK